MDFDFQRLWCRPSVGSRFLFLLLFLVESCERVGDSEGYTDCKCLGFVRPQNFTFFPLGVFWRGDIQVFFFLGTQYYRKRGPNYASSRITVVFSAAMAERAIACLALAVFRNSFLYFPASSTFFATGRKRKIQVSQRPKILTKGNPLCPFPSPASYGCLNLCWNEDALHQKHLYSFLAKSLLLFFLCTPPSGGGNKKTWILSLILHGDRHIRRC